MSSEFESIVRRLVDESVPLSDTDQQRLNELSAQEAEDLQEQLHLDQLMRLEAEATAAGATFMDDVEALINGPSEDDGFMHRVEQLVDSGDPRPESATAPSRHSISSTAQSISGDAAIAPVNLRSSRPSPLKHAQLPWFIAIAAALILVGLLLQRNETKPAPTLASDNERNSLDTGQLERRPADYVDFGEGPATLVLGYRHELSGPRDGNLLAKGRYSLSDGICQLRLQTGTSLVLQAPAEFTISDPSKIQLHRGSLRAHVPSNAVGFRVITDHCEIVDLSTEFGVTTRPDGGTVVQTFVGLVEVVEPDGKRTPLPAPQIARIGGDLDETGDFIDVARLRMLRWQDHREALLDRDDLLLYYDFQGQNDSALTDHAGKSDATVSGTHRVQGRWPGKRALQFEYEQDVAQLDLDQPMTNFTIATWVNVDRFPMDHVALLNSAGWQPGDLHVQVTDSGALSLGIAPTAEIKSQRNAHLWKQWRSADNIVPIGQWVHLTIRANAENQEVTFFVNGRLIEKQKALGLRSITPGKTAIGKWLEARGKETRPFRGRMDELVILGSALDNREVRALYTQDGIGL